MGDDNEKKKLLQREMGTWRVTESPEKLWHNEKLEGAV